MDSTFSCLNSSLSHNAVTNDFWKNSEKSSAALANAIILSLFLLVGLPSNLLIIVSIFWQRLYVEPTHILLLNLALSDLLVCVLVLPLVIVAGFAGEFIFGSNDYIRCKVCQSGVIFTALTLFSVHILAMISLDRFIFIKFPMRYEHYMKAPRMVAAVSVLWILCFLLSTPPLYGFGDMDYTHAVSACSPRQRYETQLTRNIYYLIFLILECLFPIGLIVVTNAWVMCIVRRHLAKIYQARRSFSTKTQYVEYLKEKLNSKKKKQCRLVLVFGVILSANVITWLPIIIRSVVSLADDSEQPAWSQVLVYLCLASQSFVHPLVQASIIPELRNFCVSCLKKSLAVCKLLTYSKTVNLSLSVPHPGSLRGKKGSH